MWRNLATFILLFLLAQAANAKPIPELTENRLAHVSYVVQIDKQDSAIFDDESQEELFNLPRFNRMSASSFSIEAQTAPIYVLVIEFFKVNAYAREFKNLIAPPKIDNWFEQVSQSKSTSRISGWKDGNFLYTARTTYHS
jgi:hypothetical protein